MKRLNWFLLLAILLIILSSVIYTLQIRVFHKMEDTFFYMLQDLAFVPIQILLVTLILNELLASREKRALLNKMNMAIGIFYSEVGRTLMGHFVKFDTQAENIRNLLIIKKDWKTEVFRGVENQLSQRTYRMDPNRGDLDELKRFMGAKRSFLLVLLENPNLLEHESFTNLLWAVFHLAEELSFRSDLRQLGAADIQHLAGDIERAYRLLLTEWLLYMRHLQASYPYIFSLMIRTNPFDPNACVEIK